MYDELLQNIRAQATSYGEVLQPPCSAGSIELLRTRVQKELGVELPEEYVQFLKKVNGLDWNGLVVYASERSQIVGYRDRFIEGVVEGNLSYRALDSMNDFLVFGEDGVALYVLELCDRSYQIITTAGLTVLETFPAFEDLLTNAMEAHL